MDTKKSGAMTEAHRYKAVKMLSEGGNRISYHPHGPEVVMADAYDKLKDDRAACWAEFKVQGRQLDQIKAENEALRKDAERYRWLRVESRPAAELDAVFNTYGVPVDQAIDSAMAKDSSHD